MTNGSLWIFFNTYSCNNPDWKTNVLMSYCKINNSSCFYLSYLSFVVKGYELVLGIFVVLDLAGTEARKINWSFNFTVTKSTFLESMRRLMQWASKYDNINWWWQDVNGWYLLVNICFEALELFQNYCCILSIPEKLQEYN